VNGSPVDPKAMRSIASSRPELAALLVVVALFLAFETFTGWKIVDALDRNTVATRELSGLVRAIALPK
jgi:hypothetical protein